MKMGKHLFPQVEHDLLAGVLNEVKLGELTHKGARQRPQIQQGDEVQTFKVGRHDVVIDGNLRQVRSHQVQDGNRKKEKNGKRHLPLVRTQAFHNTDEQGPVVIFFLHIFLVLHAHCRLISISIARACVLKIL